MVSTLVFMVSTLVFTLSTLVFVFSTLVLSLWSAPWSRLYGQHIGLVFMVTTLVY
jgi:hypothetical protein